ncbi:hypothetical protein COLO4_08485 [Corchorus olitorius]|uniref:Uncharacterized protein n=1 Tax=Corchorus olitorius TaxID=93759 RepID=A0A1R3KFS4_9ROSI|nr:hypothetical protein COLO4_08485 [Corchorus olitorius]
MVANDMQWFGRAAVKSAPKRPTLAESTHGGESDKAVYKLTPLPPWLTFYSTALIRFSGKGGVSNKVKAD